MGQRGVRAVSLACRIAGDTVAIMAIWLCWATLAPVIAGPLPLPEPQHICPAPQTVHGVGANLKSYQRRVDRCATN